MTTETFILYCSHEVLLEVSFWKFPAKSECKSCLFPGWRIQISVRLSYDLKLSPKHSIGLGSVLNSFCKNQLVSRLASSLSKKNFFPKFWYLKKILWSCYNFMICFIIFLHITCSAYTYIYIYIYIYISNNNTFVLLWLRWHKKSINIALFPLPSL